MSEYFPLPLSGVEPPLSDMECAVQDNVHRYAVEVMRPLGPILDQLPAEAVPASDSPIRGAPAEDGEGRLGGRRLTRRRGGRGEKPFRLKKGRNPPG